MHILKQAQLISNNYKIFGSRYRNLYLRAPAGFKRINYFILREASFGRSNFKLLMDGMLVSDTMDKRQIIASYNKRGFVAYESGQNVMISWR